MEPDPVGYFRLAGEPRDGRARWMPQLVGPAVPAGSEALREAQKIMYWPEGVSLLAHEPIELRVTPAADAAPQRLEGFRLQREDPSRSISGSRFSALPWRTHSANGFSCRAPGKSATLRKSGLRNNRLDGKVRAGLLRQERRRRSQRVDHRDPRAL